MLRWGVVNFQHAGVVVNSKIGVYLQSGFDCIVIVLHVAIL